MDQFESGASVLYQSHTAVPEVSRRAMVSVNATFARDLSIQLSAYLRCPVTVKYNGVEECTFASYLEARQAGFCAGAVNGFPQNTTIILDLEPSILFGFIEAMLGGKPSIRSVPNRAPTEIEKQLVTRVMSSITAELDRAWNTVGRVSLQFSTIEGDPQLPRLYSSSEAVVVAHFEVAVGEQSGTFTILTPVHPIEVILESGADQGLDGLESSETARVVRALLESAVHFDVWLEGVSLQLGDVMQLQEGHVIKFDYPTDRNLQCTLNGATGFPGQVVSTGRKRAFLIQAEAG